MCAALYFFQLQFVLDKKNLSLTWFNEAYLVMASIFMQVSICFVYSFAFPLAFGPFIRVITGLNNSVFCIA
jgi:hypothetical protein